MSLLNQKKASVYDQEIQQSHTELVIKRNFEKVVYDLSLLNQMQSILVSLLLLTLVVHCGEQYALVLKSSSFGGITRSGAEVWLTIRLFMSL